MGHLKFVISLIMITLFSMALIGFGINFARDNNADITISEDALFNNTKDALGGNVTVFYGDINTSSQALAEATISTQTEASEGGTTIKVGPKTALQTTIIVIKNSFERIFGSDSEFSIFFTGFITILSFMGIMYIAKAWFGRTPD